MWVYEVAPAVSDTTSGSADTLDAYLALRETAQTVWMNMWRSIGKGAVLTSLTGIVHRLRHWTTAGSGGSGVTPQGVRPPDQPAASTVVATGAFTPGTVSGVTILGFGHGATGPGGWAARSESSKKTLESGAADEWNWNSITAGAVALNFEDFGEIEE